MQQQPTSNTMNELKQSLQAAGVILLFLAPGLAVMAWAISLQSEAALTPLFGAAVLVGFLAAGLIVAAKGIDVKADIGGAISQ